MGYSVRTDRYRYSEWYVTDQTNRDTKAFVTPEAIEAVCMVGSAEDIIDQIRELEKHGIKEINIMPAADYCRPAFKDFAERVIPAFR